MGALPAWRTRIARGQVEVAGGFIEDDEVRCWSGTDLLAEELALGFITFASGKGLFLRVKPKARIARPRVHWLRVVACAAFHNWACWAMVASG